jgi:pimeloyl-ACP methyl ester carboxylesterase/predicted glycosyltransferase
VSAPTVQGVRRRGGSAAASPDTGSRAAAPVESGFAELDGVGVHYEVFGDADDTILFLPPWAINHSRFWKGQVPYLSRHFRVVTFDPRGNGRSDRPETAEAYSDELAAAHTLAVMDATATKHAVLVIHCGSAAKGLLLASDHGERVAGAVFMAPALPITPPLPERVVSFDAEHAEHDGWAKQNRHYWQTDFRDYLEFFFRRVFTEPHSTKQIEDGVAWGLETTPDLLTATVDASTLDEASVRELMARVRCPTLVVQGDQDALIPPDRGRAFADATGAQLVELEDVGHAPHARHPVQFNLMLRDFAAACFGRSAPPPTWRRAITRPTRALFISSPIGLGHAWRDVAIARELRALHPGLEIDWLAQDPVTRVLEGCGERIHPASRHLANESRHIEAEAGEHELHCFRAWRRMDEILLANFMVFHDVARSEAYDLWIGDEAWELDYYLHENPELKTAPYAWLTDFVGWLPMPDGGAQEARLTADYNAEMIEQIARFPRVRDRAIFVGDPADVVTDSFGEGLPRIADWVGAHYEFCGYVTGANAAAAEDRAALGYGPDEQICIVAVGGSGVGGALLRRVIAAYPEAKRRVPALRMIVVCGPRIDPASLPHPDGVEIRPYVHELARHLAACDLGVVQGGLTTGMELVAAGRPFLYFPLRHHFEQNFHVRHRLERYGAHRALDFETATSDTIAEAIAVELGQSVDYLPIAPGGAARAAASIAELL